MSYSNRFTGEITITPPLTHAEIRRAPTLDPSWDAHLRIDRGEIDTDAGVMVVYAAECRT